MRKHRSQLNYGPPPGALDVERDLLVRIKDEFEDLAYRTSSGPGGPLIPKASVDRCHDVIRDLAMALTGLEIIFANPPSTDSSFDLAVNLVETHNDSDDEPLLLQKLLTGEFVLNGSHLDDQWGIPFRPGDLQPMLLRMDDSIVVIEKQQKDRLVVHRFFVRSHRSGLIAAGYEIK